MQSKYQDDSLKQSNQMLQPDIDLLQTEPKDSYFFALRLITLTKNKKKGMKINVKNSHFKFILEQSDYVVDQTRTKIENVFWIIKTTTISLNKQLLNFSVPDITHSNTQFELKLYLISHEQVKQIAQMEIQTLTYVEVFLQCGKTIFRQTASICPQYTLQYEVYVHKSQIDLSNLIKDGDDQVIGMKNAFKKKTHQIIEIQNQKVQIKPKNGDCDEKIVLRKSLHVSVGKLMEIKKRNKQIKDRSMSKNASKSSFFSQIGDIFRPKQSNKLQVPILMGQQQNQVRYTQQLLNGSRIYSQEMSKGNNRGSSQRQYSLQGLWMGSNSHYSVDGQMSQQDSLKILRDKQKQRIRKQQQNQNGRLVNDGKSMQNHTVWRTYLKMFRVIIVILMVSFLIYYFYMTSISMGSRKGRYRWWRQIERHIGRVVGIR